MPESPSSEEKRSHPVAFPAPSPPSPTQTEAIESLALIDDGEASQGFLIGGAPPRDVTLTSWPWWSGPLLVRSPLLHQDCPLFIPPI